MASPIKCKPKEADLKKFRWLFPEPQSLRVIEFHEYGFRDGPDGGKVDIASAVLSCAGKTVKFILRFPRDKDYVEMAFLEDGVERELCSLRREFDIESFRGLKEVTKYLVDIIRKRLMLDGGQ